MLASLLLLLLLLAGCGDGEPTARSLVLVTLDTTRADRLGPWGHEGAETPTLDRLAEEGTVYSQAYAPAPETLPAHASLMTGLYPPSHGARLNLSFRVADELSTLAEILRDRGLHTVAVTGSAILDRRFGLDQGFLVYDGPAGARRPERRAREVTRRALLHMEQIGRRPFFLWVHYYDPHSPFEPPEELRDPEAPPESAALYDGEIAYMDRWLEKLLEGLEERGLLEETAIAVVGDHGESLGDHGETYHTLFVYDATIRVPLILTGPEIPAGRRVDRVVPSLDLFATALALLGEDEPPPSSSRVLPGLPVATESSSMARSAYSESMAPALRYDWSGLQALRTQEWLYVRAPTEELYRLGGPAPGGSVNLAWEKTEILEELRDELDGLLRAMPEPVAGEESRSQGHLTEREWQALESLGYLGATAGGEERTTGADPKDRVEVAEAFQLARLAVRLDRLERAEELLTWAVEVDPGNVACRRLLGRVHLDQERFDRAAEVFETALDRREPTWDLLMELAIALEGAGRTEEAGARFDESISSAPSAAQAWRRAARLRARTGDREGAKEALRRARELLGSPSEDTERPGEAR